MRDPRTTARVVGALYIIGTLAGVLSVAVAGGLIDEEASLEMIAANQSQLTLGAFFVLLMGISLAAMALFLYPVFRRHDETLALGMVVFRGPLEGAGYILSAITWLSLGVLATQPVSVGAEGTLVNAAATTLGHVGHRVGGITTILFTIGALMLYALFHRTRLIPRWLSVWGLLGIAPYLAGGVAAFFGAHEPAFLYAPLGIQEMVMALWLITRGFQTPLPQESPVHSDQLHSKLSTA